MYYFIKTEEVTHKLELLKYTAHTECFSSFIILVNIEYKKNKAPIFAAKCIILESKLKLR